MGYGFLFGYGNLERLPDQYDVDDDDMDPMAEQLWAMKHGLNRVEPTKNNWEMEPLQGGRHARRKAA